MYGPPDRAAPLPRSHPGKMHTHVLSVHRKSGTRVLITALVIIAPNRSCQTSPATEWKHGGGGRGTSQHRSSEKWVLQDSGYVKVQNSLAVRRGPGGAQGSFLGGWLGSVFYIWVWVTG